MDDIMRMPQAHRRHLVIANLRTISKLFPQYSNQIRTVLGLILSDAAPHTSLKATLNIFLGRHNLNTISARVQQCYISDKIRRRTLATTGSCLCHGCLSYAAEIKCAQCGKITFCYGCFDYGECYNCTGNIKQCDECTEGI